MNTAFLIAWKYLFSKKTTNAINIISYISMIGMGLGAMVLVILLSVFNGFEDLVIKLQSSFYADVEITKVKGKVFELSQEQLAGMSALEGLDSYCMVLEENAYVSYDGKSTVAKIKGFDENFSQVTDIDNYIIKGSASLSEDGQEFALLGAGIYFSIDASNNQPISIAVPKKGKAAAASAAQLFNTAQIFPSGVFGIQNEFDNVYVLTPLSFIQNLQGLDNEISGVEFKLKPNYNLQEFAQQLDELFGEEFISTTRIEQNQALYKAMRAEKFAMIAILFLVLLIISFTIIGALSMLAMEKSVDISILKAMGASPSLILQIFLIEGVLASLIGAGIGCFLGVLIVLGQEIFGFISLGTGGGFVVDAYPVKLQILDVFIALFIVFIISVLASWFPAKKAAESSLSFHKL
ncbi:MAG: ABC transporter permease [Chitinophagales bacterium]|nr:ABC transporter permease [Bacteroidota bacterium]MCB9257479.1 ABC transporter permease [Chitinophagales bacterium]